MKFRRIAAVNGKPARRGIDAIQSVTKKKPHLPRDIRRIRIADKRLAIGNFLIRA